MKTDNNYESNGMPMRVAMVFMWNQPFTNQLTGGILWGLENVGNDLSKLGFEIEFLFFSDLPQSSSALHPRFRRKSTSDVEALNAFDFVIFNTAGSSRDKKTGQWWRPILKSLKVPFAVQVHDEAEAKIPDRHEFFDHPQCKVFLPITEEILTTVVGDTRGRDVLVYPNFPTMEIMEPYRYYDQKKDGAVTSCRMTSRKRIVEFVQQAPILRKAGFTIDIHGADVTWPYVLEIKRYTNDSWKYHGAFRREDLPNILIPAKFHWNCAFLKKGRFIPRIEISTVEAVSYGCCPILCRTTTPGWVDDSMAVLVDPTDLTDLADRLNAVRHKAHEMNARFCEAFQKINRPERAHRLAELILKAVRTHTQQPVLPAPIPVGSLDPELSKLFDRLENGEGLDSPVGRFLQKKACLRIAKPHCGDHEGKAAMIDREKVTSYLNSIGAQTFQSFAKVVDDYTRALTSRGQEEPNPD